ncbi:MAG: Helix-turn-helix domain protein [Methanocella sp. PtaU1.Bin125]|nr:MAG: Helix-turn-helix domain protein [Methanocella sp. PtaU1.Bin125]
MREPIFKRSPTYHQVRHTGRPFKFEAALILIFIVLSCMLILMIASTPHREAAGWEIPGNGSVDYMFVGGEDMLYTFRGNDIAAFRSDGSLVWSFNVPGEWSVINSVEGTGYGWYTGPIVAEDAGNLYVVAVSHLTAKDRELLNRSIPPSFSRLAVIIAIAPDGRQKWQCPFHIEIPAALMTHDTEMPCTVSLRVLNGRIYLFHDYSVQIIDENLTEITLLDDLAAPPAIDGEGYVYAVRAIRPYNINSFPEMPSDVDLSHQYMWHSNVLPTSVINAYAPDGSLVWSRDIGHSAVRQAIRENTSEAYSTLPLYFNHTLFVPVSDGVIELDRQGNILLESHLTGSGTYSLFELMPVDDRGNVYIKKTHSQPMINVEYICIVAPDGRVTTTQWPYVLFGGLDGQANLPVPVSASDGVIYAFNSTGYMDAKTFDWIMRTERFNPDRLMAFDAMTGAGLWNFTVPPADKHIVRLDRENLEDALPGYTPEMAEESMARETRMGWRPDIPFFQGYTGNIKVYPGENVTYLNYYFAIYESPIVYGKSRCIYARGLYALDDQGQVLWSKPVEGLVTAMAANNSTFFYGTNDGKIGSVTGSVMVAGIAFVAIVYLFLRFFMLGTVTRARGQLDKNANRKAVLQYIIDNPGATAVDISRAQRMNLGTIRYHLFILTLNHKIVALKDGDKYLRYFTNAGTYSPEERSLLALMRREPMRKTLEQLLERPGISNQELARRLEISTTSTHHHLNELMARGVVEKAPGADRSYAYSVKEEYRSHVLKMMDRL